MEAAVAAWIVVASGFQFPEGPVWGPDGKLYLSSCGTPAVCRIDARDKWSKFAEIGCNGLAFDADGALIVCNQNDHAVVRIGKDGKRKVLADAYEGKRFHAPNDIVLDAKGTIYFTDPQGWDPAKKPMGGVYRLTREGKLTRLTDKLPTPNGIDLRPDGRTLLVASTHGQAVYEMKLDAEGRPTEPRKFADLTALKGVGPDGMCLDAKGNIYLAVFGAGAVAVIDPSGKIVDELKTPGKNPTNTCFGGRDFKTLYVTETERNEVLSLKVPVAGQRPLWERVTTTRPIHK